MSLQLENKFAFPSRVVLQLTEQCNLRCSYCYEWGDNGAYHKNNQCASLDLGIILRTIDECLPAKPVFEFFGGEPLLYSGIWEVMRRIRGGSCELAFSTNGTLLHRYASALVENGPTRLWVSLDGPAAINDQQRGRGVFDRVMRGLSALHSAKQARASRYPDVGLNYVVTPGNYEYIESFFLNSVNLDMINGISIELQSYVTQSQSDAYARLLKDEFGISQSRCAEAYVRDPAVFSGIDCDSLARQMTRVAGVCAERGIFFHCQPNTLIADDISHYLSANWPAMTDRKTRCAAPWLTAEISARGEVSTCHSFYDLAIGNLYHQPLLVIWRSVPLQRVRQHLRRELFPICTACCRYYEGACARPPAQTSQ